MSTPAPPPLPLPPPVPPTARPQGQGVRGTSLVASLLLVVGTFLACTMLVLLISHPTVSYEGDRGDSTGARYADERECDNALRGVVDPAYVGSDSVSGAELDLLCQQAVVAHVGHAVWTGFLSLLALGAGGFVLVGRRARSS